MKKNIIIIIVSFVSIFTYAQKNGDIGIYAGGSYYLGEINPTIQFKETLPAFGAFYRHNYDYRWSLRGSIYYGKLQASDLNSEYDFHQVRNHNFYLEIIDFAGMAEFNFLPYMTTSSKYNFAPYVTAGLSYMVSLNENVNGTMAIPFGIGFKLNVSERMAIGCEWSWRKTFSDEIDGLGEYETDPLTEEFLNNTTAEKYRQKSLFYRTDLYVYAGFFMSYKIAYKRYKCPAYGEKDTAD